MRENSFKFNIIVNKTEIIDEKYDIVLLKDEIDKIKEFDTIEVFLNDEFDHLAKIINIEYLSLMKFPLERISNALNLRRFKIMDEKEFIDIILGIELPNKRPTKEEYLNLLKENSFCILELERIKEPDFTYDNDPKSNRVVCLTHSKIELINKYMHNKQAVARYESLLTCLTCDHYKRDVCYFPKAEIDKIERDRHSEIIKCEFCGNKIDRLLTIMHKLYFEDKVKRESGFDINLPLLCCNCYTNINNKSFKQYLSREIFVHLPSLLLAGYFYISYILTIIMFSFWGILLFIIPCFFWLYIFIKEIRKIYLLYQGSKNYKFVFGNKLNSKSSGNGNIGNASNVGNNFEE